jgi:hypothetical protein
MTQEDQFVTDVVVTNPTQEMVASNVNIQLIGVVAKLNAIVKIHKYKGFHEGNHFIPMAMEVHNTFEHDIDHYIRECACLFHDRQSRGHLSLFFCIQFFKQRVSITLQCVLAFIIKRKITLAGDACSRPPIISRLQETLERLWVRYFPTMRGINLLLFFGSYGLFVFWPFFGLPFSSPL